MSFYEVVIEGRQGTYDMLNVLHYEAATGEDLDWTAGADELRSHISNYLKDWCMPTVSWEGITVREDLPGHVGVFYPFTLGTLTGSNGAQDALRVLALMVKKIAQNGSRPALGWIFLGGFTTVTLGATGAFEAPVLADAELYMQDIRVLGAVAASPVNMVIKARNPTAPNTVAYNLVDTFQASTVPRTLRSRRAGTGS